ncbi:thymidine phosphorylase isoform X3 [Hypanus sabinus]|uniref:thymidine phosphorylase isoform X3 n=1 Tax=Hypanus sabinus TaxID=79690 RepID=UPI0028C4EFB6|nr:thymidine phosphorylase isoform X3 [Hypanus sabinus]
MCTSREHINILEMIRKKRDKQSLSAEEIYYFVQSVTKQTIEECQIGAMLMAIRLQGMTQEETVNLTQEMKTSGVVLEWPKEWSSIVVDKHSTGGVGDKVSIVLAPALAACGCKVPMVSGRGLEHTGGTLDKLESIPGFNINKSPEEVKQILAAVGCCIVGQTPDLVPADKKMYAIRDVTSTVDSLPLIAGSIISKKGAESLAALILDVKFGEGALYKDINRARELAQYLVNVGNCLGIQTAAALSKMDNPIGRCIGNSLEVMESIECLKGKGPKDLEELVTCLGVVQAIHSLPLAKVLHELGAGRTQSNQPVNCTVGIQLLKTVGDSVKKGDPWIRIHFEEPSLSESQKRLLQHSLVIGEKVEVVPLVMEIIQFQSQGEKSHKCYV